MYQREINRRKNENLERAYLMQPKVYVNMFNVSSLCNCRNSILTAL